MSAPGPVAQSSVPATPGPRTPRRLPLAFVPLVLTYLAVALNMTVASVALPTISTQFSATASQLVWIVNITPMASAALILFAGSWGDRFGRRRILQLGILVFLTSALLSSVATSVNQLIALRGLTGVGSALVMPAALALTFDVVPERSRRTAVGIIGGTQAVGALLGPLLAGSLLIAFSWGAAFLSVTPLLLASLLMIHWCVRRDEPGQESDEPTDYVGASLMAVGGVMLLFSAVTSASHHRGSLGVLSGCVAVGVACLGALVWWERRVPHPIFVGAIVRSRRFWAPTLTIAAVQFMLGGVMFASTQYVQLVLGYSAFAAGAFLTPALVVWMVSSSTVGIMSVRFGDRSVLVVGLLLASGGLVLLASGGTQPRMLVLVIGLLLLGAMGVAPALMTHMAVSAYPETRRTVGSAINSVAVRFGLAFGAAAGGSVIASVFSRQLLPALGQLSAADAATADNGLGGALRVAGGLPDEVGAALALAARQAFAHGYSVALMAGAAGLAGLAVLNSLVMPRQAAPAGDPLEAQR